MTKSPINYKQRRENELYWLARAAEHSDIYLADAEKVADTLGLAYFNASKQLEKAAQSIFKNFQTAFNLTEAEARQLLEKYYSEKPSAAIAKAVNDITDEGEKFRLQAEMSAPAYQYRIKRLDTLAAEGKKLCETLYKVEVATNTAFLAAEYEKAYNLSTFDIQKGTGVSVAFEHVPKSRIDQVLKTNWSGKHFSTRVWDNTQELAQELSHVMAESFMTGESGYKTAQKIQERFRVGAFEARRLIRTENTYITGQAELESYEKSKIKEYKYAALMDKRTSDVCKELNGKIFPLSEAQAGKNYPPMHPFCRSSSIPIVPTYEELVAKEKKILEQIPDDMTFDEWLDSLEPTDDGMLEFKPKKKGKSVDISGESGIIKLRSDNMSISSIEVPIEQRHTGKGNPNAVLMFDIELNNRQQALLDSMPDFDRRVTVPKSSVNMSDLSALTAKTGDEFAMFTKGNERIIIRGNSKMVNIDLLIAQQLAADGYRWSGHTHPGIGINTLMPSLGDKEILKCFNQATSVIYNSKGKFATFGKE